MSAKRIAISPISRLRGKENTDDEASSDDRRPTAELPGKRQLIASRPPPINRSVCRRRSVNNGREENEISPGYFYVEATTATGSPPPLLPFGSLTPFFFSRPRSFRSGVGQLSNPRLDPTQAHSSLPETGEQPILGLSFISPCPSPPKRRRRRRSIFCPRGRNGPTTTTTLSQFSPKIPIRINLHFRKDV